MVTNDFLTRKKAVLESFFSSNLFLYIIAFIVLLFWSISQTVIGLIILLCIFALVMIFCKDCTPSIPVILCVLFVFSPEYRSLSGNEWLIAFAAIPVLAIILHFIIYKPRLKIRGFGIAVALTTIPWVLQGLGRRVQYTVDNYFDPKFIWIAYLVLALLGSFYLALYVFYDSTCSHNGDYLAKYLCKIMILTAIIICTQCLIKLIRIADESSFMSVIHKISQGEKILVLGWGGNNNIGAYLSMTVPITAFAALRHKKTAFVYYIFALIQYILVLITFSRGPMIFVSAAMPFIIIYCFIKGCKQSRIQLGMAICISVAALVLVLSVFSDKVENLFNIMLDRGVDDNGRFNIYSDALRVFKRYPIFGGGMDIYFSFTNNPPWRTEIAWFRPGIPYWFHSTITQTIAAFGAVGILAYLYQYFARYRLAFKGRKNITLFSIAVAMVLFDAYGMIDTNFYSPIMYLITLLLTLSLDKARVREPLPQKSGKLLDYHTRNY